MSTFLKTTIAFTKKVATTGAMFETSASVVKKITEPIDPAKKQIIVEYGAGHGNITRGILARMHPESLLLAFELHKEFCDVLQQNVKDPRLHVINDSVGELTKYLNKYNVKEVDCIVSAIPLTLLPAALKGQIIAESHAYLRQGGYYMQVLYSLNALKIFRQYFKVTYAPVLLNMPPAWIYTCLKSEARLSLKKQPEKKTRLF